MFVPHFRPVNAFSGPIKQKGRKGSKPIGATLNYTPRSLIPPCNYHFRTTEKTGTIWEIRRDPGFSSLIAEVQFRFPQCWRHLPTKISLRECASERRDSGQMEILSGPPCLLRTSASVLDVVDLLPSVVIAPLPTFLFFDSLFSSSMVITLVRPGVG